MKSMTGYAKRQCEIGNKRVTVEIKTLNSKQMDANVKLPLAYRNRDLEIRTMLNRLERGKVDFLLTEEDSVAGEGQLNKDLVKIRFKELQELADELHQPFMSILDSIVGQSDVWSPVSNEEVSDENWQVIAATIEETISQVDDFRSHEGEVLKQDFVKHVDLIEQKLNEVPQYESSRIETAKERIKKYLVEWTVKDVDANRFEQELIYYLEKLDITEEKVRLAKHIDYFRNTMFNEEGVGKKLGFVAQEMGREINTMGSKANQVDIQRLVVEMKDELEKIKEQLGNIL